MELLESVVGTMGRAIIALVLVSLLLMCCVVESFLIFLYCCNQMDGIIDEAVAIEEGSDYISRHRQRMTRLYRNHRNYVTV